MIAGRWGAAHGGVYNSIRKLYRRRKTKEAQLTRLCIEVRLRAPNEKNVKDPGAHVINQ